jgi:Phosphotransferase enzyme family
VARRGQAFAAQLRGQLATQYLDCLARIHNADWRSADMPSFDVPDADDHPVARRQLNWWSRVCREDAVQIMPIAVLTERWLRQNIPTCNDPVLVHGDYRTGNFLFDEASGTITAILDWEYAHLGDFHEDLAWMLQALYATHQDGETYVCGLYPKDEFIGEYERLSGRTVDPKTLRWYEILCAWKCLAITLATSTKARVTATTTRTSCCPGWVRSETCSSPNCAMCTAAGRSRYCRPSSKSAAPGRPAPCTSNASPLNRWTPRTTARSRWSPSTGRAPAQCRSLKRPCCIASGDGAIGPSTGTILLRFRGHSPWIATRSTCGRRRRPSLSAHQAATRALPGSRTRL